MAKKNGKGNWDLEPQKSSAAQFLTYIASTGAGGEKYEIRYENENIWMSQKMLAAVYGVDKRTISYHIAKVFKDSELDKKGSSPKILDSWDCREDIARCNESSGWRRGQFRHEHPKRRVRPRCKWL